jgi:hypothetical protein
MPIQAQQSYTINEYGTYIIDNNSGNVIKLPVKQDLFFIKFWKNYALFSLIGVHGSILFNIDSGSVSEILYEPHHYGFKIFEDKNYFVIFLWGYIYKLDQINLKIIEKTYVGELYKYPETELAEYNDRTIVKIGERSIRYISDEDNTYIDITYGPKINMNYPITAYNSILNLFAICVVTEGYE